MYAGEQLPPVHASIADVEKNLNLALGYDELAGIPADKI
jgi:hypothetical protein